MPVGLSSDEVRDYAKYTAFVVAHPHYDRVTSLGRFRNRLENWLGKPSGFTEHARWWLLHNCVAHPLLGLFPNQRAVSYHDWTSMKLNQWAYPKDPSPLPLIDNRVAWLRHNVLAHIAIGLYPCLWTFHYHDVTALDMNVKGWV